VAAEAPIDDLAPGAWIRATEELFPVAWITMVLAVAYIGIYFAVERLAGPNPLPGPGWF
jgi:hypothetical protein